MSEVELIKRYRDGHETRERMPRWLAELEIGTIPMNQPNVASAKIVPYTPVIDAKANYKPSRVNWQAAFKLSAALSPILVA